MHILFQTFQNKDFVSLFCLFFLLDGLEKRFDSLSASVSERAEQLQTAMAQSVSVQEGLRCLLSWLDNLDLKPGPVEATAHAVQDAMTQNQVGFSKEQCCFVFLKNALICAYIPPP